MLLKLFKGTGPGVIFLIVIMLGALWTGAFLDPQPQGLSLYEIKPMPLYGILKDLFGAHQVAGTVFSFLLLACLLFLLVNFNTTVFFINERTFLPAILYLLITSVFPELQVLNPVLPATLFLMLAVIRIMDSYRKPGTAFNFFDAGILISIGSLFYASMIWFGILAIIGIALLRTGNLKEIILSLIGLATPYILVTGIYYVAGFDLKVFLDDIIYNLTGVSPDFIFPKLTIVVLIWSGLIILISVGFLIMMMNSKKIKSRKTFYLLLWVFFISGGLFFLLRSVSAEMIWISAIPASYFLTHYFVFAKKKILTELIISVFFLLVILLQVFRFFR
jgi:hypothetical protein